MHCTLSRQGNPPRSTYLFNCPTYHCVLDFRVSPRCHVKNMHCTRKNRFRLTDTDWKIPWVPPFLSKNWIPWRLYFLNGSKFTETRGFQINQYRRPALFVKLLTHIARRVILSTNISYLIFTEEYANYQVKENFLKIKFNWKIIFREKIKCYQEAPVSILSTW